MQILDSTWHLKKPMKNLINLNNLQEISEKRGSIVFSINIFNNCESLYALDCRYLPSYTDEVFMNSFFPHFTKLYNKIEPATRNLNNKDFKDKLKPIYKYKKVKHFSRGLSKWSNSLHTQLRVGRSFLAICDPWDPYLPFLIRLQPFFSTNLCALRVPACSALISSIEHAL